MSTSDRRDGDSDVAHLQLADFPLTEVGIAHTPLAARIDAPCQPGIQRGVEGYVAIHPPFVRCLEDLEGFDRVWLIFVFNRSQGWRDRVKPPRGRGKRGLFATRGPHRPSSLGLTSARLLRVEGARLYLDELDLLDQSPVVDIKPYITAVDAFPSARSGWVDEVAEQRPRKRR